MLLIYTVSESITALDIEKNYTKKLETGESCEGGRIL